MAPWTLFTKVRGAKEADGEGKPAQARPATEEAATAALPRGPLDSVGQQSEQIRERITNLSLRLDDLKSLADDFGQIIEPVTDMIGQHAHSQSKLLEVEALLVRERESLAATRAELNELHMTSARSFGELAAVTSELKSLKDEIRERDAQLTQMRLRSDDQDAAIDSLERQIVSETERARLLTDENQALRIDVDSLEQLRARNEGELADAREQIVIANNENARLQQLAESLSQRMSALKSQILELEPQIQAGRQEINILQTKLSTEQLARQKAEVTREAERSAQDAEISSLSMKIEGLNAHMATTEKILSNLRDQLRDKTEALRSTEKALKDALTERAVSERRLESAAEANARQQAQMGEIQRMNGDLKDRCEMLAKALSAKESLLESNARKVTNLTSRIDQMNARFEQERAGYEAANRRLIEELQSEKAERSLAQGALDIARNSRSKLLTQYTALKRQQALSSAQPLELGPDDEIVGRAEPSDNVRVFKSGERAE
jgi:crescentin